MPKFSRTNKQRAAFLNGLTRSLILNGKIVTTLSRAKATKVSADKLINKAKKNTLANIRAIGATVGPDSAKKLIKEIAPQFANRKGGYTRVIHLPTRKSDASKMAVLEIVQ